MVSFTSVLHPAVWGTISALLNPYLFFIGCQKEEIEITKEKESEHKYVQIESTNSMNMEQVNEYIASTNIMILTDVHTKKLSSYTKEKWWKHFPLL